MAPNNMHVRMVTHIACIFNIFLTFFITCLCHTSTWNAAANQVSGSKDAGSSAESCQGLSVTLWLADDMTAMGCLSLLTASSRPLLLVALPAVDSRVLLDSLPQAKWFWNVLLSAGFSLQKQLDHSPETKHKKFFALLMSGNIQQASNQGCSEDWGVGGQQKHDLCWNCSSS